MNCPLWTIVHIQAFPDGNSLRFMANPLRCPCWTISGMEAVDKGVGVGDLQPLVLITDSTIWADNMQPTDMICGTHHNNHNNSTAPTPSQVRTSVLVWFWCVGFFLLWFFESYEGCNFHLWSCRLKNFGICGKNLALYKTEDCNSCSSSCSSKNPGQSTHFESYEGCNVNLLSCRLYNFGKCCRSLVLKAFQDIFFCYSCSGRIHVLLLDV